jgi:predicted nucleic acid-binding protein
MNPDAVLVDSSVFIHYLRQSIDPVGQLQKLFPLDNLYICGVVRMEVLRGIKLPIALQHTSDFMDVMQNIPTDNKLWEQASILAWELDRMGIVLPGQDIVIAACARRAEAAVLSRDKHFKKIPNLVVIDQF